MTAQPVSDRDPEAMADDELYAMAARTKAKVSEALRELSALNQELRRRVGQSRDLHVPDRSPGRPEGAT